MYIELKTGYSDNVPAWIGIANFSQSGQTIYFDNKAFKKAKLVKGNFFNLETGDEYWISGVKKSGEDRHWAGNGKIMIERVAIPEYLEITNSNSIDSSKFIIVDIAPTDKSRFAEIENRELK